MISANIIPNDFHPTPASIPPKLHNLRMKIPDGAALPVHLHPLNPLDFVLKAAKICPNKVALVHPDTECPVYYTFAIMAQRIQNLAYALISFGIRPGDRVAVLSPNTPMMAESAHGVIAARAVWTPINTRLAKAEIKYILQHSGSKLILVDHGYAHLVDGTSVQTIISKDTGRIGCPYEAFLEKGRQYSNELGWSGLEIELDENTAATLCYTSGTSGTPKGVVTTLRGSCLAALASVHESRLSNDSVYLWILPMFHASGWTYPWSLNASFATQILIRNLSYPRIWKHFLQSGVTHYNAAPTVQIEIISSPEARRLERPIIASLGGSAPTIHLIGELEKLNIHVVHVYGLTETYGPISRNYVQVLRENATLEERAKYMGRQGHPCLTAQEIRVIYMDDKEELVDVPADGKTVGEVVMRGNMVMKEYFRNPEATKKTFRGGYFHTGDLAVMHEDGSIAIKDRIKDIIISGGENASSLAIETELAEFPAVQEVAVVARPHPKWGERPMAFVILTEAGKKEYAGRHKEFEANLKRFARTRLPGFASPEWIRVVDKLPKTSTGKIVKTELRSIVAKL